MIDPTTDGGCFCGAVRYRTTKDPVFSLWCFCKDCRVRAGTDGYAGYMVNDGDFEHLQGETSHIDTIAESGRTVARHFCPACGSHLWGRTELGLTSIAAGTLDDPDLFKPDRVAFAEQAPSWARLPDINNE